MHENPFDLMVLAGAAFGVLSLPIALGLIAVLMERE